MKFGIYFLLRKSEFLPNYNLTRRSIQWSKIKFYHGIDKKMNWIDNDCNKVTSMEINIARSKTDQYGVGRIVRHTTVEGPNCICKQMFKWKLRCMASVGAVESDGIF